MDKWSQCGDQAWDWWNRYDVVNGHPWRKEGWISAVSVFSWIFFVVINVSKLTNIANGDSSDLWLRLLESLLFKQLGIKKEKHKKKGAGGGDDVEFTDLLGSCRLYVQTRVGVQFLNEKRTTWLPAVPTADNSELSKSVHKFLRHQSIPFCVCLHKDLDNRYWLSPNFCVLRNSIMLHKTDFIILVRSTNPDWETYVTRPKFPIMFPSTKLVAKCRITEPSEEISGQNPITASFGQIVN